VPELTACKLAAANMRLGVADGARPISQAFGRGGSTRHLNGNQGWVNQAPI